MNTLLQEIRETLKELAEVQATLDEVRQRNNEMTYILNECMNAPKQEVSN